MKRIISMFLVAAVLIVSIPLTVIADTAADYRNINKFLGNFYSWNGNFSFDDKGLVLAAYAISRDELFGGKFPDPDGGYAVPAGKVESVLKQYFGVTKVNGAEFGYKDNPNYDLGWCGYKNGYYREIPDDGLVATTVPNVAKFSNNGNGTYTAVVDEYSSIGSLPDNWYDPVNQWKLQAGMKIVTGNPVRDNPNIIAKQTSAKTFILKQVAGSYQVLSINGVTIPKTLFAYEDAQKIANLAAQNVFGGKVKFTPSVLKDGSKLKITLNGESCYFFSVDSPKDSKGIPLYLGTLAVAPVSGKVYYYDMTLGVPNGSWKLVYTVSASTAGSVVSNITATQSASAINVNWGVVTSARYAVYYIYRNNATGAFGDWTVKAVDTTSYSIPNPARGVTYFITILPYGDNPRVYGGFSSYTQVRT